MANEIKTKKDLSEVLHLVGVTVREGENFLDDVSIPQKIAYWEMSWRDFTSSGEGYQTKVTYQISYVTDKGRDAYIKRLKWLLNSKGCYPDIYHEYVHGTNGPGYHHWYLSVDVLEDPLEGFVG